MREHKLEDEKGKKIYVNKDTNSSLKKLLITHKCFQNPIHFLWKELTFFRSAWKLITYKIHQVQNSEPMFRKSKILPDVETFFFQRFSQMRYCIMSCLLSSAFVMKSSWVLENCFLTVPTLLWRRMYTRSIFRAFIKAFDPHNKLERYVVELSPADRWGHWHAVKLWTHPKSAVNELCSSDPNLGSLAVASMPYSKMLSDPSSENGNTEYFTVRGGWEKNALTWCWGWGPDCTFLRRLS